MRRILITFIALMVAIPLAIGVMAGLAYYSTGDTSVPGPVLTLQGVEVAPAGYQWRVPVFGGIIYRDFEKQAIEGERVPELNEPTLALQAPSGYEAAIEVQLNNKTAWTGTTAELFNYKFNINGEYKLKVECTREDEGASGYGTLTYICNMKVAVEPRVEASDEWVVQGDVVALRVYNLPAGVQPTATTDLGEVRFLPDEDGTMTAYVPTGHAREPYIYNVNVQVQRQTWEIPIRVIEANFEMENIIVREEDPLNPTPEPDPTPAVKTVGKACPADYREYSEKIRPLFEDAGDTQYWTGLFSAPIRGEITIDYGLYTYRSNSQNPLRQSGVGYNADEGAPVVAPNAGVVVFAEEMDDCGLTVVIEHGGGLKSLFFFLGEMDVQVGDSVTRDQQIGAVGKRGFSEDAQVYYEARLGYETVNPKLLFDGSSELYYFS